ncbi:hypothetical protein [Paraglaciecola sp. 20A4]|uniref:hypothetical protein n=1 Tax=Paraglaciecola sp. 20A4 TaxID=2687288 RepID=UPI00140E30A5|nr:hypothetical protein [Paraglaciecola sp. 20A4]
MKNVYVICPGDSVTGGPELIHQFIDAVNSVGGNASVLYYPFSHNYDIPSPYKHYNVKVEKKGSISADNSIIIVPEIATQYIKYFEKFEIFIWWLSVDNYFNAFPMGLKGKLKSVIKKLVKHRNRPKYLNEMNQYSHLAQSHYAMQFLKDNGYESSLLSDYLNKEHFVQEADLEKKENIICYNPKKGLEVTQYIIETYPKMKFVPIQNMNHKEVADLLKRSKIYIDFGKHPGKDRLPREAAMANCVVITGMKGSAGNEYDIPVPKKYKLDENSSDFISKVDQIISFVFNDYESSLQDFGHYRERIQNERELFLDQVSNLVRKECS